MRHARNVQCASACEHGRNVHSCKAQPQKLPSVASGSKRAPSAETNPPSSDDTVEVDEIFVPWNQTLTDSPSTMWAATINRPLAGIEYDAEPRPLPFSSIHTRPEPLVPVGGMSAAMLTLDGTLISSEPVPLEDMPENRQARGALEELVTICEAGGVCESECGTRDEASTIEHGLRLHAKHPLLR